MQIPDYIIHHVNSHDALAKALEGALDDIVRLTPTKAIYSTEGCDFG